MSGLRFLLGVFVAVLPSWLKIPLYRSWYGYRIGSGVRIGFSPFVGVTRCEIGDGVRIGSFNLFLRIGQLEIGRHTQIGFANLIRGGARVTIGSYVSILRLNVFNAILDGEVLKPEDSTLTLGPGAVVTTGHWLDFSARIELDRKSVV